MSWASELARRLARECTTISNGRRQGRYWAVGNVANNKKERSLFVRLTGPAAGRGAAGH
jgi:hypothetical protein